MRRERKVRELWDAFAEDQDEEKTIWPDDLMVIAKRLANGIRDTPVPRGATEKQHQSAARLQRMQAKYPVILSVPEH